MTTTISSVFQRVSPEKHHHDDPLLAAVAHPQDRITTENVVKLMQSRNWDEALYSSVRVIESETGRVLGRFELLFCVSFVSEIRRNGVHIGFDLLHIRFEFIHICFYFAYVFFD